MNLNVPELSFPTNISSVQNFLYRCKEEFTILSGQEFSSSQVFFPTPECLNPLSQSKLQTHLVLKLLSTNSDWGTAPGLKAPSHFQLGFPPEMHRQCNQYVRAPAHFKEQTQGCLRAKAMIWTFCPGERLRSLVLGKGLWCLCGKWRMKQAGTYLCWPLTATSSHLPRFFFHSFFPLLKHPTLPWGWAEWNVTYL